jgi:CBS domain-containing protein
MEGADIDITRTPVEAVMLTPVAFVTTSSTIEEALTVMNEIDRRHLPVYENEKLVGMVSLSDLSRWFTQELETKVQYLESYIRGY